TVLIFPSGASVNDPRLIDKPETEANGRATPSPVQPLLWTVDDLAKALSCSRRTIERLEGAGKLGVKRVKIGRMVRYVASECRAWVENGCRELQGQNIHSPAKKGREK